MTGKQMLAVDFGASGGRVMQGKYDGTQITIQELHRFSNDPVLLSENHGSTMYWDFLRLFHELKTGILKSKTEGSAVSIGVDTWGVDYGFIDKSGRLLGNPVHYRDVRTAGMPAKAFGKINKERLYEITGNQMMELNTVYQLMAEKEQRRENLRMADKMLLMPDLFNYYLSGQAVSEYTIASTTQMLDAAKRDWSDEVLKGLEIPRHILAPIVMPGKNLGEMRKTLTEELGCGKMEVMAVAGHDTQSAMAAVPAKEEDFIFLSCGTWSLLGTELGSPIIGKKSYGCNMTNEGGYGGRISFLKNIIGLWLIQESRRQWIREGSEYSFGQLEAMAAKTPSHGSFINPDAPEFVPSGNVPERIRAFCKKTGQPVPDSVGAVVRCINESLALKYKLVLDEIQDCTKKDYKAVYLVGGGAQSALLCQMTANACRLPVIAGLTEATVYGNLAIQLLATGELKDLQEARRVIGNSENLKVYEPENAAYWQDALHRADAIIRD